MSSQYFVIYPGKYYKTDNDGVVKVKSVSVSLSVANNQTVITAVSGKVLRILSYKIQSTTATQGSYVLKDGSGGSTLDGGFSAPLAGLPLIMPHWDAGYFETSSGVGLFADAATGAQTIQVYYVEITP